MKNNGHASYFLKHKAIRGLYGISDLTRDFRLKDKCFKMRKVPLT